MGKRVSPTLIGMFVVGAVVLAVIAVVIFGSGRLFRKTHPFVAYFQGSVNGLRVGAPVKFKGVQVGEVSSILLNLGERGIEQETGQIRIPVIFELDAKRIRTRGGEIELDNPDLIDSWIGQGLRAQLNMESVVTGLLYISLDVRPQTPVDLVGAPGGKYQEIPTIPTALEQVRTAAAEIIAKMEEINFGDLIESATETVHGLNEIVRSPQLKSAVERLDGAIEHIDEAAVSIRKLADNVDTQVGPMAKNLESASGDAGAALREAEATLKSVQMLLEPNSPAMYKLGRALEDIAGAARAIRVLAEYLERDPAALVRGKDVDKGKR